MFNAYSSQENTKYFVMLILRTDIYISKLLGFQYFVRLVFEVVLSKVLKINTFFTVTTHRLSMRYIPAFLMFFLSFSILSQSNFVIVDSILIEGNDRTKDYVLLQEMDFATGDTLDLAQITSIFKTNSDRLLGTGLFVFVKFNIGNLDAISKKAKIILAVKESWYIFPVPILEITDRNFNEWYYDYNASLKRINYGIEFDYHNFSGNNDALGFKIQGGVTKKLELDYTNPNIIKSKNIGLDFNTLYKYSKEISYNTIGNKPAKYKNYEKNVIKLFRIRLGFIYRPSIQNKSTFKVYYFNNNISSTIANDYNPNFFGSGLRQRYFSLKYIFEHDNRKFKIYPDRGYMINISLEKRGLGIFNDIDQLIVKSKIEKYFKVTNYFISGYVFGAKKQLLAGKYGYFNNIALGYRDDFLNGYELYVIDGEDYAYLKTAQRFRFLKGVLEMNKFMPIKQFKYIPYDFYFCINSDFGYVNNNLNFTYNDFTNRFLYGGGVSLDMIIYNVLFRFSYSFNHTGESGFFFYISSGLWDG